MKHWLIGVAAFAAATGCIRREREPAVALEEQQEAAEEARATLEVREIAPPPGAHPAAPEHGESATLEVDVAGIELVEPGGEPKEGEGHLGYRIDGEGPVLRTTRQRIGFHELPRGVHQITVRLLRNDGTPLGPERTISVGGKKVASHDFDDPLRRDEPGAGAKAKAGELPKPVVTPPEGVALDAKLEDEAANAKNRVMTVKVDVDGLELVDPISVALTPRQGQGHLHYRLDGGPVVATTAKTLCFHDLTSGEHTLSIMLARNDHAPLGVERTLTFTIP